MHPSIEDKRPKDRRIVMLANALEGSREKVGILLESFAMLDRCDHLCRRWGAAKVEGDHRCAGAQMDFEDFSRFKIHGNQSTSPIDLRNR